MATIFISYYISAILHPAKTFAVLLTNKRSLLLGFYAVMVMAVLYTLVYAFLILGGGQPFKPWLDIPLDSYYKYNLFFCAPSMLIGWILAAALTHTITRIFTTAGTFEHTLCLFGFGIGIASWATGLHDLVTSFLGAIQVINQHNYEIALNSPTIWRALLWLMMAAYLLWFVVLFSKAVKTVYGLSNFRSVWLGIVAFASYQLFFLIFNR